jgi:hypothetical protein
MDAARIRRFNVLFSALNDCAKRLIIYIAPCSTVLAHRLERALARRVLRVARAAKVIERGAAPLRIRTRRGAQPRARRCVRWQREAEAAGSHAERAVAARVNAQPPAVRLPCKAERAVSERSEQQVSTTTPSILPRREMRVRSGRSAGWPMTARQNGFMTRATESLVGLEEAPPRVGGRQARHRSRSSASLVLSARAHLSWCSRRAAGL